jgi:hypothetical protein
MRTASKDTSRPIPENNAIGTSGLVFDFSDEVVGTEIGGEIRAAFGISGSPMHKWFKNPCPLESRRNYD